MSPCLSLSVSCFHVTHSLTTNRRYHGNAFAGKKRRLKWNYASTAAEATAETAAAETAAAETAEAETAEAETAAAETAEAANQLLVLLILIVERRACFKDNSSLHISIHHCTFCASLHVKTSPG